MSNSARDEIARLITQGWDSKRIRKDRPDLIDALDQFLGRKSVGRAGAGPQPIPVEDPNF